MLRVSTSFGAFDSDSPVRSGNHTIQTHHWQSDRPFPADSDLGDAYCVVMFHGYGAHGRRATFRRLGSAFLDDDPLCRGIVSLDFHGHGASTRDGSPGPGATRGMIESGQQLIGDATAVVRDGVVRLYPSYWIVGHSMGGAVALGVVAARVGNCRGLILLAPLLRPVVPCCLRPLVHWAGARFPRAGVPEWLYCENELWSDVCWSDPLYRAYAVADWYPQNPDGLAYGGNLMLGTVRALDELGALAERFVDDGVFRRRRALILHDPGDAVVAGYTDLDPTVTVAPLVGGLHDILANRFDDAWDRIRAFIR